MNLDRLRLKWGFINMNRYYTRFLATGALIASLVMPSVVQAQDDFYAHYNSFLYHKISLSARSMGMGGAYTGLRDTATALRGNPAGLGWVENYYVTLDGSYQETSSAVSFDDPVLPGNSGSTTADAEMWSPGVGFAMPFDWGGVGITYNYRDDDIESGNAQLSTQSAGIDGSLERHDVSLAGAYKASEQLSLGFRYKYSDWDGEFNTNITGPLPPFTLVQDNQDFEGHQTHFGLQYYVPNYEVTFGLDGYYGFGERDSSLANGDADADSWAIRGGFGWHVHPEYPVLVALDLNFENRDLDGSGLDTEEDLFGVHLGAEYEVYESVFLRAGYQVEDIDFDDNSALIFESPTYSGYTAGLGYTYQEMLNFDYAFLYSDTGDGDIAHFFSVGYEF